MILEKCLTQEVVIHKYGITTVFDQTQHKNELLSSAPISFKNEGEGHIFRVQVNAKMTNFVISTKGYVLSGEPFNRSFSEYWDISVNSSGKWYLVNIRSQIQ